jgi:hypothetical protein
LSFEVVVKFGNIETESKRDAQIALAFLMPEPCPLAEHHALNNAVEGQQCKQGHTQCHCFSVCVGLNWSSVAGLGEVFASPGEAT